MKHTELKIEWIPLEKLSNVSNNSKIHTNEQIRHIANSIERFGFNDPLAISGQCNTILEGNGRIEAANLLGIKQLPCVRLDHLNEEEQRAYVIAHNALCLETGFDEAVLLEELKALQDSIDFQSLGIVQEKYISKLSELEEEELKPYQKVHYLFSFDLNIHDEVVELIEQIKQIKGVEIETTFN